MKGPQVTIGRPLYGQIPALASLSFTTAVVDGAANGLVAAVTHSVGAYIDVARNELVRNAFDNDSTHLLFVDQDMVIPNDCLARLVVHDLPVVGGVYFHKGIPHKPVAFELEPFAGIDDYDPHGLTKVGGIGMGCTLISCEVLKKMEAHFEDQWWFKLGEGKGEDVHFAYRLAELGVESYIDGTVECGHISEIVVGRGHFERAKEMEKAKEGESRRGLGCE